MEDPRKNIQRLSIIIRISLMVIILLLLIFLYFLHFYLEIYYDVKRIYDYIKDYNIIDDVKKIYGIIKTIWPRSTSIYFNYPFTKDMWGVLNLHDVIFFHLILILVATTWVLKTILIVFNRGKNKFVKEISWRSLIEMIWTVGPIFILIFIIKPSFNLLYLQDDLRVPLYTIKIIGHQWYWEYEIRTSSNYWTNIQFRKVMQSFRPHSCLLNYENKNDNIYSYLRISYDSILQKKTCFYFNLFQVTQVLYILTLQTVRIILTSLDVIHSWAVPSLGIKVDAIPGRLNQTTITILNEGMFFGQCSEICGENHGRMPIEVIAYHVKDKFF